MPVLKNQRWELFCQGIVRRLTQTQAAINAGFSARSSESAASRLAKNVKVKARIVELQQQIETAQGAEDFVSGQVRERTYRVLVLDEMLGRMRRLVESRAKKLKDIPGGESGMLVRKLKALGRGKDFQVIEEYEFDAALVNQIRETTKEISIECGQRTEKQEHMLKPVAPAEDLSKVPIEVLLAVREKLLEAEREADRMLIEAAPGSVEVVETNSE
jgi:hypothetical protein